MQYADCGERCQRWRGIRSETLDLDGPRVHLLRADSVPDVLPDAPTQLLVHGLSGSGTAWLDVIPSLASFGPVVAPDLPGSIFGETTTQRASQARLEPNVACLDRLTAALGLDRLTLHGLSMGGMAALRFAAQHRERVDRLITGASRSSSPPALAQPREPQIDALEPPEDTAHAPTMTPHRRRVHARRGAAFPHRTRIRSREHRRSFARHVSWRQDDARIRFVSAVAAQSRVDNDCILSVPRALRRASGTSENHFHRENVLYSISPCSRR